MFEKKGNSLYAKLQFSDFSEAFGFIAQVALIAEKLNHHPKIINVYSTVELILSTHDAGDSITELDYTLAKEIETIVNKTNTPMFSLKQIQQAHSKVLTWADFPQYIQDLISLGVRSYSIFVVDGHANYEWDNNYSLTSVAEYEDIIINTSTNKEQFLHRLQEHQQGKTNYHTFCKDAGASGITKWIVNLNNMECSYLGNDNNIVFVEKIVN